jgi:hypothetical protein
MDTDEPFDVLSATAAAGAATKRRKVNIAAALLPNVHVSTAIQNYDCQSQATAVGTPSSSSGLPPAVGETSAASGGGFVRVMTETLPLASTAPSFASKITVIDINSPTASTFLKVCAGCTSCCVECCVSMFMFQFDLRLWCLSRAPDNTYNSLQIVSGIEQPRTLLAECPFQKSWPSCVTGRGRLPRPSLIVCLFCCDGIVCIPEQNVSFVLFVV